MSTGAKPAAHPPGLYALFFTEMWERFNYYGLRGFLVLYLTRYLKLEDDVANGVIYANFTALAYMTPLIGGYLADRVLGQRKAIFIGGLLMALGQFTLMADDRLWQGLSLLIIGNGFFKPNISTMVGTLYGEKDPRRDGAYTIFYMGINIGAFLAPLVCGFLAERYDWNYGFAAAGVGMIISVIIFQASQGIIGSGGFPPGREAGPGSRLNPRDWAEIGAIVLGCVALGWGFVAAYPQFLRPIFSPAWLESALKSVMGGTYDLGIWIYRMALVGAACWGINRAYAARKAGGGVQPGGSAEDRPLTAEEWQRMALIAIVTAFATCFWAGFEQAGSTMNLFADRETQRMVGGFEVPASWLQSINPMFIFLLAPLFAAMWTRLGGTGRDLPATAKQGFGLVLLGLGFIVMKMADDAGEAGAKVGMFWLVGVYFLHTVGELFLSPIGLSLVNRLSPARFASLMMATWFLANFAANYLAGTMEARMRAYGLDLWNFLAAVGIGSGVLMLALTPVFRRMAHGRD